MWTVGSARAAAAHLPRGPLVVLPGAGHIGTLLQAAPAVVELIGAFGATRPRPSPATAPARAPASRPPAA
jgi:hypothetical protein